ncbi:MAG: RNase adapter RapZ [Eggerthellaceae bacterium]|nr:RNase adapter RapZ [Eggerthellaceae bacterium]
MEQTTEMPELVIVSGMSGAGRTEAMHVFEDLGYFCVDNLPPGLIGDLLRMPDFSASADGSRKIAVVCDSRGRGFFSSMSTVLKRLKESGISYKILFLDASDEKLISRYKSSRRRHPLCEDGASIATGLERERSLLRELKSSADFVIDTTNLLPAELRGKLKDLFAAGAMREGLSVSVYSFGFKHGAPVDADLVIDVRFLPNPFYDPEMRTMTGLDEKVRDYVLYNSNTEQFLKHWKALLDCVMPGYVAEGKQQLAIAVGCTGGQHRSVALAEVTGDYLRACGYRVSVAHRDLALAVRSDGELVNADPFADAGTV